LLSYLITDPHFYKNFKTTLENSIEKFNPDYICFRDKFSTQNAKLAIEIAHFYKIPILVNQYTELLKLGFDGIHFTSKQLNIIHNYKETLTFASTHSLNEIKLAKDADFITFSPIFNSKGRKGVGVETLNKMADIKKEIFALGGIISDKEVEKLKGSRAVGFASIRYFLQN